MFKGWRKDAKEMKKFLLPIIAVCFVVVVAWSTPYISAYQIKQAVATGDSKSISEKVNFPALKENLKIKFTASLNERMEELKDNPFAGMAQMMMMSLVNSMVDLYVSPSGLSLLFDGKKPNLDKKSKESEGQKNNKSEDDLAVNYSYVSLNKFEITVSNKKSPSDKFSFFLNRDGIFNWQLVDISFPGLDK